MKQITKQDDEVPLLDAITLFCWIAVLALLVLSVFVSKRVEMKPQNELEYRNTEQSVLYAWESPVLHYQVLGCMTGSTIDRLIACESGGDHSAINHHDPITRSVGILQFKDETYKHFCVEQYGLPNDIWNPTNQIKCAERMIKEGYGNHWGCWK